VLRKVTAAPFGSSRVDPAVAMSLLQHAAREQDTLLIGYLDPAGVATQRMVSPITVKGGQLVASIRLWTACATSHPPHHVGGVGARTIMDGMRADDDAEHSDGWGTTRFAGRVALDV